MSEKFCCERTNRFIQVYNDCLLFKSACNFVSATHQAKEKFEALPDKDKKALLFIIITDPAINAYPYIKYRCDTELGIPSQHVRHDTVLKTLGATSQRILYQMALKINAKLNGVNQELEWSEHAEISVEEKERRRTAPLTMYVGIDVTHPTTGSGIDYSIASIVASINPGATKYRDMVVTQQEMSPGERPVQRGIETTDILEGKLVKLLRIFAEVSVLQTFFNRAHFQRLLPKFICHKRALVYFRAQP